MQLSRRNQLAATVRAIALGGIMAEVVMELDGGQELVAAITRGSVERMGPRGRSARCRDHQGHRGHGRAGVGQTVIGSRAVNS